MEENINLSAKGKIDQVIISSGGMEIRIIGSQLTFSIGSHRWYLSVGECEAMLESHVPAIISLKQILTVVSIPVNPDNRCVITDHSEMRDAIILASAALIKANAI